MTNEYQRLLESKRRLAPSCGLDVEPENPMLYPHQRDITRWALRKGRAAVWLECGLGKTPVALEWSRAVRDATGGRVLILAPLAVAGQFVREGRKFGVDVTIARSDDDVTDGIVVANYERLHRFDAGQFAGVVLDESSVLKDYTAKTRNQLIRSFAETPYRLACTATPSPNDFVELGNHAEFLGVMSRTEMLSTFFVHDGGSTQDWRLKGHAQGDFFRWLASWAVALRSPADLGYDGSSYEIPPLNTHHIVVETPKHAGTGQLSLIQTQASGLLEHRQARKSSLAMRVARAAEIVAAEPDETWLVWCDLNDESAALTKAIPGAVEVKGSDSVEHKETALAGFSDGAIRVLVSKPSIAGWGLNWQHCSRVVFVGLSHSFEQYYQAVRRTWRFGQTRPVECHIVTSDREGSVVETLKRKQADAAKLVDGLVEEMRETMASELRGAVRTADPYEPKVDMTIPTWVGQDDEEREVA